MDGITVARLPYFGPRKVRGFIYAAFLVVFLALRVRSYDLVHVHLATIHLDAVVLVAKLLSRPVYAKLGAGGALGDIGKLRRIAWLTNYFGLRHADRVQALSAEIESELTSVGVEARRIVRIPNGIDAGPFVPADDAERVRLRHRLGLPDGPIVLFVGRLASYKGIPELLEVWRESPPPATLLLVGSRTYTDRPVSEIGSVPNVIVREYTNEIACYYQAADVFVLPSKYEGLSNALLEAMSSALPPVVAAVAAHADLIVPSQNGYLVPPGDVGALRAALTTLTSDRELRSRIGRAARSTVAQYDIAGVVDRIAAEYATLLE